MIRSATHYVNKFLSGKTNPNPSPIRFTSGLWFGLSVISAVSFRANPFLGWQDPSLA